MTGPAVSSQPWTSAGVVGRAGLPGFIIGNTAENVINHVSCSP
jgi:hypothetical protein